ncbi:unnamed protein product [Moneuplotes crassus]|uniref:Uncharacterized protein n=1 Tax=Euplotes crassus TaxID=5936 RepID=A0AAD1X5Q6_EUPCR|nr:unnamed protein product [Moneuplotes crassus]
MEKTGPKVKFVCEVRGCSGLGEIYVGKAIGVCKKCHERDYSGKIWEEMDFERIRGEIEQIGGVVNRLAQSKLDSSDDLSEKAAEELKEEIEACKKKFEEIQENLLKAASESDYTECLAIEDNVKNKFRGLLLEEEMEKVFSAINANEVQAFLANLFPQSSTEEDETESQERKNMPSTESCEIENNGMSCSNQGSRIQYTENESSMTEENKDSRHNNGNQINSTAVICVDDPIVQERDIERYLSIALEGLNRDWGILIKPSSTFNYYHKNPDFQFMLFKKIICAIRLCINPNIGIFLKMKLKHTINVLDSQYGTVCALFRLRLNLNNPKDLEFLDDINHASSTLEDDQARLVNVNSILFNNVPDPKDNAIKQVIQSQNFHPFPKSTNKLINPFPKFQNLSKFHNFPKIPQISFKNSVTILKNLGLRTKSCKHCDFRLKVNKNYLMRFFPEEVKEFSFNKGGVLSSNFSYYEDGVLQACSKTLRKVGIYNYELTSTQLFCILLTSQKSRLVDLEGCKFDLSTEFDFTYALEDSNISKISLASCSLIGQNSWEESPDSLIKLLNSLLKCSSMNKSLKHLVLSKTDYEQLKFERYLDLNDIKIKIIKAP